MALSDILNSLLMSGAGGTNGALTLGQSAGAVDPGQSTAPGGQTSTPLSELVVQGQRKAPLKQAIPPLTPAAAPPQMAPPLTASLDQPNPGVSQTGNGPALNYNNTGALGAVQGSVAQDNPGAANPGIYGLLPPNLQHGTLRNVLGSIGDAFLEHAGQAPQYRPAMERQEIGNAQAGLDINDPASVEATAQRMVATGAPGAQEAAAQLRQTASEAALRKATLENTALYHQSTIDARHDALFQRMQPSAMADLSQAKNEGDFQTKLALWNARIKAIDPNEDAISALGAPTNYGQLTGTAGMTNQQITQHQDRLSGQANTHLDAILSANARIDAAGISGGAGIKRARIEADAQESDSSTNYLRSLANKQDSGQPLTNAEQNIWDHATSVPRTARRPLPASVAPRPQGSSGGFSHIAVGPGGQRVGWNGKTWVPIK